MELLLYNLAHPTPLFLVLGLIQLVAIYFVFRAIRTARTPQGAVGWVVFLIATPHFAVPAFLFFGHARYPGYIRMRRAMSEVIATLRREGNKHANDPDIPSDSPLASRISGFERLAGFPSVGGNSTRLLIDGAATFDAIFQAVEAAQSYVLVQFYTIRDDALGRELAALLKARVKAGVAVHVLYDSIGSSGLSKKFLQDLRDAGIDIRNFHALRQARSRFQVNFRNHRKIVVVDGNIGFVGGHNLGEEYLGHSKQMGAWRDTHLRIDGPAVAQLQLAFAEDWLWSSGNKLVLSWRPAPTKDDRRILVMSTGPADRFETGSLYFSNAIGAARERVWIASPYFVPDGDVLTALKLAALRGLDVRLLLPEKRDHWLVWLAGHAYFDEVRRAGVKLLRYPEEDGFLHQKVLLIDDEFAAIGSHNLDNRSCRLNFESSALVFDSDFAAEVEAMLSADMARARPVRRRLDEMGFWLSNAALAARIFAPVL
ncbi:cardiolipin synthase A [Allgaiera indica]|uniref:Cardiolipin synthase n=1 Tax=Allgaiera indica TaxID=765699 RepID=A0AAN4UR52_9RHOB|nr:cardiolipin synthase [Allgaiera indica]GHE01651.1 cardiolipin synthase A [Allgaiera indica]SDW97321.1 cardiolipin synthase [Allgaiera indica]